jgi:uncharacterized protein YdhG (YjbR/CyaY superfamily)
MPSFDDCDDILSDLGKYKTGKSCIYIKKLEYVDYNKLKELVHKSVKHMNKLTEFER